jgi:hypothetical protein
LQAGKKINDLLAFKRPPFIQERRRMAYADSANSIFVACTCSDAMP